jgi:hypothetical protein
MAEFTCDRLHDRCFNAIGIEHDRERIAGKPSFGEDVKGSEGKLYVCHLDAQRAASARSFSAASRINLGGGRQRKPERFQRTPSHSGSKHEMEEALIVICTFRQAAREQWFFALSFNPQIERRTLLN